MDTGNLILVLAVAGIGVYALQQSQKRSAVEEMQLQALQLQREKTLLKASERSRGEKIGGGVEAGIDWVKSFF